ncbi:ABC transporter ATP-binding protein [Pseudopelagicola sp. nBUS_20]|uniref:ABC transporter ATP-binding protein n=1 Tax=Pseudopelagicola sp. nBUS_20 TaxID=3395317 RepID=UPI003EB77D80
MADVILSTQGLIREFGAFRAVDQVSINIRRGSITGLIGPNGAGKSTFFNTITGDQKPTSGTITLDGEDITGRSPDRLFNNGLARTFQIPRPFARMTVLENVMLAPVKQVGERLWGPFLSRKAVMGQERDIRDLAMQTLDFVTLAPLADHPAGKISGGQMKLLELARVLMGDPKMILLDEPAAGVNPTLTGTLIEKIEALNAQGKTFIIIEHDMDFIMRHCDPIIALTEGRVVFEGSASAAQQSSVLRDAYLGGTADA